MFGCLALPEKCCSTIVTSTCTSYSAAPVSTNELRSPKRHVTLIQEILISYCKYAQTPFGKRDLGTRLADAMV